MSRAAHRTRRLALPAVMLACLAPAAPAVCRGEDDLETLQQQAFQAAVDRVAPSVVRIETLGGLERAGGALLGTGPTTGLVVDPEGYVISSAFGFLNRPDSILVRMPDGTRRPAELVATDHNRMVVLLKIRAERPLPVPELVPEGQMHIGQWAIAVGRAFEADRPNMSVGILSALNRVWGKAVQTDAAVSPNNYGGPLLDVRGRVLGLLVPLSPQADTDMAGVEWYDSGIGFAVPMHDLVKTLPRLKQGEDLHPGVIGISFAAGNLSTSEPVIAARHPNSPASEAEIQAGDRIVEVDGRKIVRTSQVKEALARRYAGEAIRMVVLRDGRRIERELTLVAELEPYEHPLLGILPMRPRVGTDEAPQGVTVRYVYAGGPAEEAGIERGDVLAALGEEPIRDADDLRRRIAEFRPDAEVELEIRRGQETLRLAVRLGRLPEDVPSDTLPPAREDTQRPRGGSAETAGAERPQAGAMQLKTPEFENDAWAYVPESYDPAVRYGLIVWLHGPGQLDWDELLARWKPHCDRGDLILLAPAAAGPDAWRMQEITLVRKLLDQLSSTYTLDPARIAVHGHQSGGRLAYLVAFAGRERVRAAAAVDAPLTGRPPENDPVYRLAFYVAWAKQSERAEQIAAGVTRLREMKLPVTVRDLGEKPRYLSPEELAELVRWIDTLDCI